MKSQIEKCGQMAPKGSEEKKIEQSGLLSFEAMHVLFEPLKFTVWGEERGRSQDWSFLYPEQVKPVPWGL